MRVEHEAAIVAAGLGDSRFRVLHVDADREACLAVERALAGVGFEVLTACSLQDALRVLSAVRIDLLIVEQYLGGALTGFELARRASALWPWIAVVILASEDDTGLLFHTLEGAGDECIEKPEELRELVARSRRIAWRVTRGSCPPGVVAWGSLEVDFVGGVARAQGEEIELQPLQLRLLGYLLMNVGRLVTREELRRHVFRTAQRAGSTSISRQISVLRERLGPSGRLIVTLQGGYGIAEGGDAVPTYSFGPTPRRFIQR